MISSFQIHMSIAPVESLTCLYHLMIFLGLSVYNTCRSRHILAGEVVCHSFKPMHYSLACHMQVICIVHVDPSGVSQNGEGAEYLYSKACCTGNIKPHAATCWKKYGGIRNMGYRSGLGLGHLVLGNRQK